MFIFILNLAFGAILAPLKCKNPYPPDPRFRDTLPELAPLFPDPRSTHHEYGHLEGCTVCPFVNTSF